MCLAHPPEHPAAAPSPTCRGKHPDAAQPEPTAAPIPEPGPGTAPIHRGAGTSRRKLWDIPRKYHCPIIGTCLAVDELRRLAARVGGRAGRRLDDYEVHVSFVSAADGRNALSLACHKTLDRKFGAEVRRFARAGAGELAGLWDEARAQGRVPAAFWALMSDPRASESLVRRAYEEVHMLSHQVGAGLVAEARALADAREEAARLGREAAAQARRSERRIAEREARIAELAREAGRVRELEAALAAARERLARLESGAELARLRERLAAVEPRLADLEHRTAQATLRAERWRARCEEARREPRGIQAPPEPDLPAPDGASMAGAACPCPGDGICEDCPNLAGRRVLCIGGRDTLAEHYRALVDRCNGRFFRHDGGIGDSPQRLAAMLAAADAVVCPADCVSHDAYYLAKRFCKRTAKPCILLRTSGVVAFARALRLIAD